MDPDLRELVEQCAHFCCEYCRLPEALAPIVPFHVEHIVAKQQGGPTTVPNLAHACHQRNLHEGPNVSSVESPRGKLVRLFNPRRHEWSYHFRWDGSYRIGRTPIGRVTVDVVAMNDPLRVAPRQSPLDEGLFPRSEG
jgi:hypothetical protein